MDEEENKTQTTQHPLKSWAVINHIIVITHINLTKHTHTHLYTEHISQMSLIICYLSSKGFEVDLLTGSGGSIHNCSDL